MVCASSGVLLGLLVCLLASLPYSMQYSTHPLTMMVDWDQFDEDSATDDNATGDEGGARVAAVKLAVNKVVSYLSNYFQVYANNELAFSAFKCSNKRFDIGAKYMENVDFYIKVFLDDQELNDSPVSSLNCLQDSQTGRPVVGILFVNLASTPTTAPETWELFRVYMHEVFHMLGFSQYIFQNYPKEANGANRENLAQEADIGGVVKASELIIPAVVEYAKDYFNCPSLTGVPLSAEKNGDTIGSHWNFLFFSREIMNPAGTKDARISLFTLKTLSSTGWYIIDDDAAELFIDGKGSGCPAISEVCPDTSAAGQCNPADNGKKICSLDIQSKVRCSTQNDFGYPAKGKQCSYLENTMEYCFQDTGLIHEGFDDTVEEITNASRCFMVKKDAESDAQPRCLTFECDSDNSKVVVKLKDGTTYECTSETQQASGGGATLTCPPLSSVCPSSSETTCPSSCELELGGLCLSDGKCFCFFGPKDENSPGEGCLLEPPEETSSSTSTFHSLVSGALLTLYVTLLA